MKLIAVSNHEFYDNRLVLFPSPDAKREETGLHFRHEAGTCHERGVRKRFNAGEARAVADAVMAVTEASRLFGFKRVGKEIQTRFKVVLRDLVTVGVLQERGGQLHAATPDGRKGSQADGSQSGRRP